MLSFLVKSATQSACGDERNNAWESILQTPVAKKYYLRKLLRTLDFHAGSVQPPPGSVVLWDLLLGMTDLGVVQFYVSLILLPSL